MSHGGRKKLTQEEKSKRAVKKARRKAARTDLKHQMEAALRERRELEERAERAGIELAKPSDIKDIPKENMR